MAEPIKFLTIAKIKDSFYQLSKDEQNELIAKSIEHVLEYKQKMGEKFRFFSTTGPGCVISISESESLEEYARSLQSPGAVAGHMNYESTPLIEMDESSMQAMIQATRSKG